MAIGSGIRKSHLTITPLQGLARQHQSGSSVSGKPRISKVGTVQGLVYAGQGDVVQNSLGHKVLRNRLAAAAKPPQLIIGAMMRKLLQVAFGVLKSAQPFQSVLHDC